ncbi:MAG: hypothetical protein ACLFRY_05115 [Spirochaetia bacterium]
MRRIGLTLGVFFALASAVFADDLEDILEAVDEDIYSVHIHARVYESGEISTWNMDVKKFTIAGKKVIVKLEGENVLVVAELTPYLQSDDSILLVAQGEVWITTPQDEQIKYSSVIKSLPIQYGDKVYFYPLGVGKIKDAFIIELEIEVNPYRTVARNGKR